VRKFITGKKYQNKFKDVDIIAAPVPVTTDRDDLINFVEPYFERNGLMIGITYIKYKSVVLNILIFSYDASSDFQITI